MEAANLANNHTIDYGEKSYTDTIEVLEEEGINAFGNETTAIVNVKGVKVGTFREPMNWIGIWTVKKR